MAIRVPTLIGFGLALLMTGTALAAPASQTSSMSIAAVVNEDVITTYDVQSRLGLSFAAGGIENTPDMQRRLIPQVINRLIDEHLQTQEARRLKITVSETEIRQSVDAIEQNNGMQSGGIRAMLAQHNVDMGTFYAQVEADLAWRKVVRKDLSRDVQVAPQEMQAVLAKLKADQGKPEHQLSEIFLPVEQGSSDQNTRALADRLVQQARTGTPFANLARQFSRSATAATGGDLDWMIQGSLEPELDAAVAKMEPGEISEPVHTASGYHIIALRARRTAGAPDPRASIVTLSQIYLPTLGGRTLPVAKLAELSDGISTQVKNCADMNKWAKDVGGPGSGPVSQMYIGSLPKKVSDAVVDLPIDRVTPPIEVGGARLFLMVCSRKDDSGIPSEDQIMQKLQSDKLNNAQRQKLNDLRRAALIETRM